jgi:RNA-directed DNA polymerase
MSSREETKTQTETSSGDWTQIPWPKLEKYVYRLQKRIYRASERGNNQAVHRLQQLLMRSEAARTLAVRKVTQDNQGKKTAGVDGKTALTYQERLELVPKLLPAEISKKPLPVKRIWIPKPGKTEKRPLGIPTIKDRAVQALAKMAMEPEWEARFEPDSYGFRPGRSAHDAIDAIFTYIRYQPKWVLDADIAGCFDNINHEALLRKLETYPTMKRLVRGWLKAGVMENQTFSLTEAGTPQGGVISPLLANIALHGLEEQVKKVGKRGGEVYLVRYADDFVVLSPNLAQIEKAKAVAEGTLREMGLELKPSKTRVIHTKEGFDFLGFNVRQYPVGKYQSGTNKYGTPLGFKTLIKPSNEAVKRHSRAMQTAVRRKRSASQQELIDDLGPIISGWANYYRTVVSSEVFSKCDDVVYHQLRRWAYRRHPGKNRTWIVRKYWGINRGQGWAFLSPEGGKLVDHTSTHIRRHVKVQGKKSPYDGNLVYWSQRLKDHPLVNDTEGKLLRSQQGRCAICGLRFMDGDLLRVDHILPRSLGGKDWLLNKQLLHHHCHQRKTATDGSLVGLKGAKGI